ncbi:methyltransferase domain-containing protein [Aurantiacibacter marinus]|uniref:Methyltransferase type 11 domain-containing protein n=1 Tax=Aurantiacibacter marinus TaxID=874156 RepID=A0A0H0XMU8_9SPHN|nr:methyltransferase domain-containing protein [Aurantiacibacter marinus]KLI63903.1 hypothetical protein AAV99_09420 [Aurantiacibacter marinus]
MANAPPIIFSNRRKAVRRKRAEIMGRRSAADPFLFAHISADIEDRLAFIRFEPETVLLDGFGSEQMRGVDWRQMPAFDSTGLHDFDVPSNLLSASFDCVASINSLGTVNDLPGALIQMRELLKPGGLAIASFVGGASLAKLRRAMFEAEPERPAARMHPLIDPRSCPGLLQRAGWTNPVVDSHMLTVRYSTFDRLVQDLREQALGNVLASPAPPLGRTAFQRAREAFMAMADDDGKVSETFEIITLTGRRSPAGT